MSYFATLNTLNSKNINMAANNIENTRSRNEQKCTRPNKCITNDGQKPQHNIHNGIKTVISQQMSR